MKKQKDYTSIDEDTKNELLNVFSPSTNKGEIKTSKNTETTLTPPVKPTGGVSVYEPEVDPITGEGGEEPYSPESLISIGNPNADTEIDFSLSKKEFNKKYLDNKSYDPVAVTASEVNNISYDKYGEGVEDYRDYIDNPMHNVNLDYTRAISQSGWEQARRSAGTFLLNVIPEVIDQTAATVESVGNLFSSEDSYGNPISEAMKDIKENTNKNFDIYLEDPSASMAVGDSGWWASRLSSLATSATAFVALGYATGGLAGGTRMANLLGRAGNPGKALSGFLKQEIAAGSKMAEVIKSTIAGKQGVSAATIGDAALSSYLLTSAESMGVATEVYHKEFEKQFKEFKLLGLSDAEAKKEADIRALKAGDRAFMFNQWNIGLNMTSTMPFLRGARLQGAIAKRTTVGGIKKLGLEGTQESLEELVNLVSEKRATDMDYSFEKAMEDIATAEGAEAAFLGFIGGFAQTGITLSGQFIKKPGGISGYDAYKAQYAMQEEAREGFDKYATGEKGNELDIYKSTSDQVKTYNKLNKLYEQQEKATSEEEVKKIEREIKDLSENMFISQAYTAFKHGLGEHFIESLETRLTASDEEITKAGHDPTKYRETLTQKIEDLKSLEKIFNYSNTLYEGDKIYSHMASSYYFKSLKDQYTKDMQEEGDIYLKSVQEQYSSYNIAQSLDISLEEGEIKTSVKPTTTKEKDTNEKELVKLDKKLISLDLKLSKAKERLRQGKQNKEVVSEGQVKVLEKEVENIINEISFTKEEKVEVKEKLKNIGDTVKEEENFVNTIKDFVPSDNYETKRDNLQKVIKEEKKNKDKADELASISGQALAKKRYLAGREILEKIKAEARAEKRKTKREAKKQASKENTKAETKKETKEKVEEVEETEEVVNPLETLLDSTEAINVSDVETGIEIANQVSNDFISDIHNILSTTVDNTLRQEYLIGYLVKKGETLTPIALAKALELYSLLEQKVSGIPVTSSLEDIKEFNNVNDYVTMYEGIEKNPSSTDQAENINNHAFNLSPEQDDDIEKSKAVEEQLKETAEEEETKTFGIWMEELLAENGLTTNSPMKYIVPALIRDVGEDMARSIFYKVQGYIMYNTGERNAKFFKDFVDTTETIQEIENEQKAQEIDQYDLATTAELIDRNREDARTEILLEEGILIPTNEDINFVDSIRSTSPAYQIAFKTVVSKRQYQGNNEITTVGTGVLSEVDTRLLTKNGIKEGDEITFQVQAIFKDNKGNSFYSTQENGKWKVEIKNEDEGFSIEHKGEKAAEYIPIQIVLNGNPVKDAFVHLPSFINDENIPYNKEQEEALKLKLAEVGGDISLVSPEFIPKIKKEDLDRELINLRSLRNSILNGEEIVAKVNERKGGFLIKTEAASTAVNLPNARLAVFDGNSFITSKGVKLETNKVGVAGRTYAMIPKDTPEGVQYFPYALYKNKLTTEQQAIVLEIVRLKLSTSYTEEDKRALKYYKDNGVDLESTTYDAHKAFLSLLKTYISVRIMPKNLDIKSAVLGTKNPLFLIRYDEGRTIFKAGQNKVIALDFGKVLGKKDLNRQLESLSALLKDTLINTHINKLGENTFIPDTNKGGESLNSYNAFIKDNTTVDIKSIKVDGEDVYKVQRTVVFTPMNEKTTRMAEEAAKEESTKKKESVSKRREEDIQEIVEETPVEVQEAEGLFEDIEETTGESMFDEDGNFIEDNEENFNYNMADFDTIDYTKEEESIEYLKKEGEITGTDENNKLCKL